MPAKLNCGDPIPLRSTYGRISFGGTMHHQIVSWSAPNALDILTSQAWRGIYLYPSMDLSPEELVRDPIKVCDPFATAAHAFAVDWNHDGADELIVAGRNTILYFAERTRNEPYPYFEDSGPLRAKDDGLVISIPYENPYNKLQNQGGYIDTRFHNYTCIAVFPTSWSNAIDLIIGDWAGSLWWLPDQRRGQGSPCYDGEEYEKEDPSRPDKHGFIEQFGTRFVKPRWKVADPNGEPFLLGRGHHCGKDFPGGWTRPYVFCDPGADSRDLLVLAGQQACTTHYLEHAGQNSEGVPVFRNLGPVQMKGLDLGELSHHGSLSVVDWNRDGAADLLVCTWPYIGLLERKESPSQVPAFRFKGWIEAKDAPTFGDHFMAVLRDRHSGDRLLVDGHMAKPVSVRRIVAQGGRIRLEENETPIQDQNGPFLRGDSQTDLHRDLAVHKLARWDFDGSGRQHLIIGNDGGKLYLLIEEEDFSAGNGYRMRSVGPLSDQAGHVIKIHNRVCPAAVDLDGDGREDLLLAAASYQGGVPLDPNPGGGLYYVLHHGLNDEGLPRLSSPQMMLADGQPLRFEMNRNVQVQVIEVDGDGQKEIITSCSHGGSEGTIYRLARGAIALKDTGLSLPECHVGSYLLDIDDDGKPELVESGGERRLGFYRKIRLS